MDWRKACLVVILALAVSACDEAPIGSWNSGCAINAARDQLPQQVQKVQLGMSLAALSRLLGRPDYAPTKGQYYFFTGGLCPMAPGADMMATCGVIAEFRRFDYGGSAKDTVTDELQSCSWGAIGE